jgi:hypothetical protein
MRLFPAVLKLMRPATPRQSLRVTLGAATALSCLPAAAADAGTPAPDPFFERSSACVAVMKADLLALTERYQSGEPAVRADIERLTELGFSFVGTAYKRGLRKPLADKLLDEAERVQVLQAPVTLQALSTSCQAEGARLLAEANFLERALVRNRARARVDDLLAPDPH